MRYVAVVIFVWFALVVLTVHDTNLRRAATEARGEILLNDTGNNAIVIMTGWFFGLFYVGVLWFARWCWLRYGRLLLPARTV